MTASAYVVLVPSRKEPAGTITKPQRYAVAIPDIANLEDFVGKWPQVVRQRSPALFKFRPRESIIDVAGEAGLDVTRQVLEVVGAEQGALAAGLFRGVDVFLIEAGARGSSLLSVSRVDATRRMVNEYARVRAAAYRSPLFRRHRILNVLGERPWWFGFARLCSTTPDEMTIRHQQFQQDCATALTEVEMKQDATVANQTLEHLVYHRVEAYVLGKTKRKYDLSWREAKGDPAEEERYKTKKEKVAREAFLAVRSRTGADFVAYFTSTICSVPHHVTEEKYVEIARALMDPNEVERVRSLTLLALSAIA